MRLGKLLCLHVFVLAGTSEGLAGPEFYCELVIGVVAPSDPVGSILVKILHSVKGGDVE